MFKSSMEDQSQPKLVGRFWHWPDGTILPLIRGGDGEEDDEEDEEEDDDESEEEDPPKKKKSKNLVSMTQADFDALMAKNRKEAKAAIDKDFKKALGVENMDQLKAIVAKHTEDENKNKSEVDKATGELSTEKSERAKAEARAAALELTTTIEKAILRSTPGLSIDQAEIIRRLVAVEPEADDDDVKAAIKALKKAMPQVFAVDDGEGDEEEDEEEEDEESSPRKRALKNSNPGGGPRKKKKVDNVTEAHKIFAQRHPDKVAAKK